MPSTACSQNLNAKGLLPICAPANQPKGDCYGVVPESILHEYCMGQPLNQPIQAIMCVNPQTNEQRFFPYNSIISDCEALGAPWTPAVCYCCCGGFLIGGPLLDGNKATLPIHSLQKGDAISVGSLTGDSIAWEEGEVGFVSGLASENAPAIYLLASGTKTYELLCSPNLPFVLSDGKLIAAELIRPGDVLLDGDGMECVVQSYGVGNSFQPIYRISNGGAYNGSLAGRFLSMNGLLVGDYELELHLQELPANLLANDRKEKTLEAMNARPTQFMGPDGQGVTMNLYGMDSPGGSFIGFRTFFTEGQEKDVLANGVMLPADDPRPGNNVSYAFKLLTGFYPEVVFEYDEANLTPTVLASKTSSGQKKVKITAGLARQSVMQVDGIVMAVAWGIACLYAGKPTNKQGYAAVGWADYWAFGIVSREIWPNFVPECMAALDQWTALFAFVSPENAQGNPKDPINDPSLDCRIEAAGCGSVGSDLPTCVTQPS